MKRSRRHNEKGISLLLSLLALLLLSAVAMGMMFMSSTESTISGNFKSEETAYFAARAGVEEVRDRALAANGNSVNALLPTTMPGGGATGVLYVLQNGTTAADLQNLGGPLGIPNFATTLRSAA